MSVLFLLCIWRWGGLGWLRKGNDNEKLVENREAKFEVNPGCLQLRFVIATCCMYIRLVEGRRQLANIKTIEIPFIILMMQLNIDCI